MHNNSGIFLGSEIKQGGEDALFHIFPVPFEKSVSYGQGTANGANAIVAASDQLETFDQITGEACKFGIHTHQAIDCRGTPSDVMQRIRAQTEQSAANKKIPFVFGGEHTVSYGAIRGVADAYGEQAIGVVQFDAHADLRDNYEGSPWSHASVMKRVVDDGLMLFQLGVRAISMEEKAIRAELPSQIQYIDALDLCRPIPRHDFVLPANFPEKIYISVDIDALDASVMPATGTPVPGGLAFWQLIDLIQAAARDRQIVGMDLVEFAPISGFHAYDYLAADLAYKMMGIAASSWKLPLP
ncbi:MAG: agmatinase [Cardiobacteriaceae bacterium]|nr:agmatinase [Cardiobacteriaceae bacterium]